MRFGVLGPVEVRQGDTPLRLGTGRERFVLAVLLINADRLVTAGGLIDLLWTDPPPTAKAQVHNIISRLRHRLADDELIVTNLGGYELHLGEHTLDLLRFRELVERAGRADHGPAAELLTEALALWRGPALADVEDQLATPIRQALHDERLAATEAALDADLALGRHDEVLRALREPLAEHPYRERLHELRMSALAAAGRRAEALAAYRDARTLFTTELGLEPGPELRRLERQVLCAEPVPVQPTPRQLPPVTPVLTGRDEPLGEIRAALRGPVGVAVLVGPGGVGKTTLALAAAHELTREFPDGHLYADLRGTRSRPVDPLDVAARFLRGWGVAGSAVPQQADERIALYRSYLAGRRVLVVLDDAGGEEQVRPLLPGTAASAVLVTSRRRLSALVGVARWTVPVLASDAAVALLAEIVGAARVAREPGAAAEIAGLCGGLPLAVCVSAARLAGHPEWTLAGFRRRLADERGRLDELTVGDLDVRASITLSYQALDPAARRLFRGLGLLTTPDWPSWVAGVLGDAPALDRLVDAHLVERLGRSRLRLHDLVADVARERLAEDHPAERVRGTNRLVSAWLALATDADERLGHGMLVAAGLPAPPPPPGVTAGGADWFETERANLVAAVGQACAAGDADLAGALALRVAGFLAMRSYDDDCEHTLADALARVRAAGTDRMLVRLLGAVFAVRAQLNRYADLPAIADEELAVARRLGDPHREFHALTHRGRAARMLGHHAEAAEWLSRALSTARAAGLSGRELSRALHSRATVLVDLGRPEEALSLLDEVLATERRGVGDRRILAMYLHGYGIALTDAGRLAEAEETLAEALEAAGELGDERGVAWVEQALADVDLRAGRHASARARLSRALDAQERVGDREGIAAALRSQADLAAGRPEAVPLLRHSLEIWRELGARLEQAVTLDRLSHCVAGAAEECRALLAELGLDERCLRTPPVWSVRCGRSHA